jgi:1,3-beta-glucanosyltransferase GAS1
VLTCQGVAYQLVPADPLVDTVQCTADATLMQTLGTNAIRVYHVDPAQNHDGCMQAFDAAGIYAFIDMDTFNTQIEQVGYTFYGNVC